MLVKQSCAHFVAHNFSPHFLLRTQFYSQTQFFLKVNFLQLFHIIWLVDFGFLKNARSCTVHYAGMGDFSGSTGNVPGGSGLKSPVFFNYNKLV